jgi:hypothetical protein
MFKRGGSSFQAQGTGITSPYDTPRKKYITGGWGEWEEQTRALTKDPRGDFSYAAEGFSHLANPYKESGEAKTIGEMLFEGAGGVRGSREKASELEKKGELAILESQAGRMLTEEERAWKEAQTAKQHAHDLQVKKHTYMDQHPAKTYRDNVKKWTNWSKTYENRDGHATVSKNIEAFAQADMIVANQLIDDYRADKTSLAQAVPPEAFKDDNTIDISTLIEGVVYYDPMSKSWFTVNNAGTENATVIPAESYIDGWHNAQKPSTGTSTTNGTNNNALESTGTQEIDLVEKITGDFTEFDFNDKGAILDEAAKIGIKIVEKPAGASPNWKNYIDEKAMTLFDFTEILKRKQFKDKYANIKGGNQRGNISVAKKATGGRVGYAEGDLVEDPLDELKLWWKESIENNEG